MRKRVMVDAEIDATRQFLASSRRLAGLSERRKWLDARAVDTRCRRKCRVEAAHANGFAAGSR